MIRNRLFSCTLLFCFALVVGCSGGEAQPTISADEMSEAEEIALQMEAAAEEEEESVEP